MYFDGGRHMSQQAWIHDRGRRVSSGKNVYVIAVIGKIFREAQRPLDGNAASRRKYMSNQQDLLVIVRGRSRSQPPTITYRVPF